MSRNLPNIDLQSKRPSRLRAWHNGLGSSDYAMPDDGVDIVATAA
jgi:hypothetical protein